VLLIYSQPKLTAATEDLVAALRGRGALEAIRRTNRAVDLGCIAADAVVGIFTQRARRIDQIGLDPSACVDTTRLLPAVATAPPEKVRCLAATPSSEASML
jgi:hypothetical protein